MLLYILKQLDNLAVLYSLVDINNEWLDCLIREHTFSNTLNFASIIHNTKIIGSILGRFCNYILSWIHWNVKCLIIEPASPEHILLATYYSNLIQLKFFNFKRDSSLRYFTGKPKFYISSTERSKYNDIE
jgi:hypothetical protein